MSLDCTSLVVDWLMDGARSTPLAQEVLTDLCQRLAACGLPLWRVVVFVRTLHPQILGRRFVWRPDTGTVITEGRFDLLERDVFRNSPMAHVGKTGEAVRRRLADADCPMDYPILQDLRAEGVTDYVVSPLRFTDGDTHFASWTTRQPGGFSDAEIVALDSVAAPLARVAEIRALHRVASILLSTYVGQNAGERVLAGRIRRGDTEEIHAAIWLSDMRGFTKLADRLPPQQLVDLLNCYFDCQVPPGAAIAAVGVIAVALLSMAQARAEPVEDFYKAHPITMLVGSGAGGGYDVYARAFARHWTDHIPGHPNIIPKNLPAAAGLAAASTLYNGAERDGSVIGAFTNGAAMDPLFGNAGAHYDALAFNWLGSIGKLENVCATWHDSAVKNIADARARDVIVAAAGATSNTAIVPNMLNALIGTRFKVVSGYDPSSGLTMAVERGEAEGICGLSWSTIKASRPHWIKDRLLNVIVQMGLAKLRDLADVPSALDLVEDAASRQVMELILMRQEAGRPFAAPPGAPADRVAALRQAFEETLADGDFIAEAEKSQLEIEPMSGEAIAKMLAKAYAAPKPIVERAAELVYPAAAKAQ